MHEFGLAKNIVGRAIEEAQRHEANQVSSMRIPLGTEEHFSKEALEFAIQAVCIDTVAEEASVHVVETPGEGVVLKSVDLGER